MRNSQEEQCIVVTGESGAGKTENTKHVLNHLFRSTKCKHSDLVSKIEQANPLLELFGNAVTELNQNSSRFGKLVELHYDGNGEIVGGKIDAFLLERSRVVHHGDRETNFHVFYGFFAGFQSSSLKDHYLLENPSSYRILRDTEDCNDSTSGIFSVEEKEKYKSQYLTAEHILTEHFKCSVEVIHQIRQILAAILHLGNVNFTVDPGTDEIIIYDDNPLHNAYNLLGMEDITMEDFVESLCSTVTYSKNEKIVRGKSKCQAEEERDAVIKHLYKLMFETVVRLVNESIKPATSAETTLGILDVSGFEKLEQKQNNFEQLLINITNERLNQYFRKAVFTAENDDLFKEGVTMSTSYTDHDSSNEVLHLCLGTKEVNYSAEGFMSKNRSRLSQGMLECLQKSNNRFVNSGNPADKAKKTPVRCGKLNDSSAKQYRESLQHLTDYLSKTRPLFIRCIKPNRQCEDSHFDADYVKQQLLYSGIRELIKIRRDGFPYRFTFEQFCKRFSLLTTECNIERSASEKCRDILRVLRTSGNDSDPALIGKTKILLKACAMEELTEQVEVKRTEEEERVRKIEAEKREKRKDSLRKRKGVSFDSTLKTENEKDKKEDDQASLPSSPPPSYTSERETKEENTKETANPKYVYLLSIDCKLRTNGLRSCGILMKPFKFVYAAAET
ncbi:hypothetical protein FSP39_025168 [Pinctada imbricata]|uniref:Myosin motor domain-containing protein n=1 Tax=Pinctada imbricata TaxID=66713 RepID=A0AA88XE10_PINIB|nr:hypothetical protein FSP39_025168 [Pinctada imbricata]